MTPQIKETGCLRSGLRTTSLEIRVPDWLEKFKAGGKGKSEERGHSGPMDKHEKVMEREKTQRM